jgi:hypothetical protein
MIATTGFLGSTLVITDINLSKINSIKGLKKPTPTPLKQMVSIKYPRHFFFNFISSDFCLSLKIGNHKKSVYNHDSKARPKPFCQKNPFGIGK